MGFPFFPPFLTMFLGYENIFITPYHCQTRSFKSTPLSLPAGWIFISYQSQLMTSTKIFTHNSKPNIKVSASSVDLAGSWLGMHDPVFCEYSTQQVGLSTSFSYKYSHCFERWAGPNYLLPFQVSVDVFVLSCRVDLLGSTPLLGQAKFWLKITSVQPGTSGHLFILPFIPTQWTHSTDHLISSESSNLAFYPSIT